MRVAALYDIHGNLPALEAVLADVERAGADLIVVGGDIVWGTFPAQTLRRVMDLGERVTVIRGNADREVAARAGTAQGLDPPVAAVNEWCADQLTPDERDFLAGLPETTTLRLGRLGTVLFCHGTPRSDEEIVTTATPDEELLETVGGSSADVIVCGHVHVQFDRLVGNKRVVNAGSVGMPYEDEPCAYWLLIDDDLHHRRTVYDFERAGEAMCASGCPDAEEFARDLLTTPGKADATAHFEGLRNRSKEVKEN